MISDFDLKWLIKPLTSGSFASDYWGKAPLRVLRSEPLYYRQLLSEEELEFALYQASTIRGAVEVLTEDETPQKCKTQAQAIQAFKDGRSLRINSIQRFSRPITKLCKNLEQTVGSSTNVNMYLTSGSGKKALKRHYDTHDVFVLQVYGRKVWRLYDPPFLSPLEFLPLLRNESIRAMKNHRLRNDQSGRDNCTLREEFTLRAGDLLYLPRGFWHEAESEPGGISCHLTVGIQPTTYLDLMTVALANAASAQLSLRQSLPLGFEVLPASTEEISTKLKTILDELPMVTDTANAISSLTAKFFRRSNVGLQNELLRTPSSELPVGLKENSTIQVRDGLICGINSQISPRQILFGHKSFVVPQNYETACSFIVEKRNFIISEIPGDLSISEKIVLVAQLILEGLLICTNQPGVNDSIQKVSWLVPIRLDYRSRSIKWLDLGHAALSEPFFDQSVKRYLKDRPTAKIKTTKFRYLREISYATKPAGFIFHISRCGSTLLANAFKANSATTVLSEPQPVNGVLTLLAQARRNDPASEKEVPRSFDLLTKLIGAYGQRSADNRQALIFKFSSWNILHISTMRALFPEVPCVIVIRDPVEVVISCLQEPPGWLQWRKQPRIADLMLGYSHDECSELSDLSFCARTIGKFLQIAESEKSSLCRLVDYKDLTRDSIVDVSNFFGIEVTSGGLKAIQTAMSIYSKDINGKLIFEDDHHVKQAKATSEILEEVRRWAQPMYDKISDKVTVES